MVEEVRLLVSKSKAKKILKDKKIKGKKLSKKQRGYFGLIAGGKKPRRASK
jgi:hypothetical protein